MPSVDSNAVATAWSALTASGIYLFSRSRSRLLGRNDTICRLVMVIDFPVLGFLPRRGDLLRTVKVPNWTSFIDSPATIVIFMTAKTVSTIAAAFRCETLSFP